MKLGGGSFHRRVKRLTHALRVRVTRWKRDAHSRQLPSRLRGDESYLDHVFSNAYYRTYGFLDRKKMDRVEDLERFTQLGRGKKTAAMISAEGQLNRARARLREVSATLNVKFGDSYEMDYRLCRLAAKHALYFAGIVRRREGAPIIKLLSSIELVTWIRGRSFSSSGKEYAIDEVIKRLESKNMEPVHAREIAREFIEILLLFTRPRKARRQ